MHSLSASFVLAYHGCTQAVGERLLAGDTFVESQNEYDWLGSGIYFWETNPDRALDWARELIERKQLKGREAKPFVVGAAVDLGFCLDLITTNGIREVEQAHVGLQDLFLTFGGSLPQNSGGDDLRFRRLDRAVIQYLHGTREVLGEPPFDTVRALFPESTPLYKNSGFRKKTHIQICVRNQDRIKGVFRVPRHHFSSK